MARGRPLDAAQELLDEFEHGGRVTEYLIGRIPARLWQRQPSDGGRTIAAIVAHIHSVRKTFAKMGGATTAPSLDRKTVTPAEAKRALRTTNDGLASLFRESLGRGEARVKGLPRRTVNMMLYLTQHDAHHRGQLMLRVREFGHELSGEDIMKVTKGHYRRAGAVRNALLSIRALRLVLERHIRHPTSALYTERRAFMPAAAK